MADVKLIATKDFSYATRRLKAGDDFTVPANMAKVLVGIGKAELPRKPSRVPAPPPEVVEKAETATPPRAASHVVPAVSTSSTRTRSGNRRRKSRAKQG